MVETIIQATSPLSTVGAGAAASAAGAASVGAASAAMAAGASAAGAAAASAGAVTAGGVSVVVWATAFRLLNRPNVASPSPRIRVDICFFMSVIFLVVRR
jgi:nucleoid-associated protein YgaU